MLELKNINLKYMDKIAVISLNRPERLNAINLTMKQELELALQDIESCSNIRVIILKGEGRAFCSGADLRSILESNGMGKPQDLEYSHKILKKILGLKQIVISAVHGFAAGAGCNLAMAADLMYAAEGTKFSQAFIKVGLVPDWGGMYLLPRLAGIRKAKEWILFGDQFCAEEALSFGVINGVFPENLLFRSVLERAQKLADSPWTAVRLIKKNLDETSDKEIEKIFEAELSAFKCCSQTSDFIEGINAFLEKRTPTFR